MKNKSFPSIRTILTILVFSILDFFITTLFQDILLTPLFFDTIFMIATLFIYGPVLAFVEYVIFNCFISLKLYIFTGSTEHIYIYIVSALSIIVVTWLFVRKKENLTKGINTTFLYILSASILAGFVCSVVSGIVTTITYSLCEETLNSEHMFDHIIYAFMDKHINFLAAAIIGRIPVTILDRIITTFAGFGLYKLYNKFIQGKKSH